MKILVACLFIITFNLNLMAKEIKEFNSTLKEKYEESYEEYLKGYKIEQKNIKNRSKEETIFLNNIKKKYGYFNFLSEEEFYQIYDKKRYKYNKKKIADR